MNRPPVRPDLFPRPLLTSHPDASDPASLIVLSLRVDAISFFDHHRIYIGSADLGARYYHQCV